MDRIISNKEKNKGKFKKVIIGVLAIVLLFFGFKYLKSTIQSTRNINDFMISKVEIGDIKSSFNAQGQIIPEKEVSINAPITTEIQEVFQKIGKPIQKGEQILKLNDEFLRLSYESNGDNLLLKKNNIKKSTIQFDKNIIDLSHDSQILALKIQEQEAELNNLKVLTKMGATTQDDIKKKEISLKILKLEKLKMDNELQFQKKFNVIEKENLALEVKINEKSLKELQTKLKNTIITSPINGTIMWVNENIGKQVLEGENIARIADLSSFKITGHCSDRYSEQISIGTKVIFRQNQTKTEGFIVNIEPVVENNQIRFDVQLNNPKQSNLRAYSKGELRIITGSKQQVKRIMRGLGIKGGKQQDVFVIRENKAVRTKIEIGASNSEYIEILSDEIHVGDKIIVSDMKDYEFKNTVELRIEN